VSIDQATTCRVPARLPGGGPIAAAGEVRKFDVGVTDQPSFQIPFYGKDYGAHAIPGGEK